MICVTKRFGSVQSSRQLGGLLLSALHAGSKTVSVVVADADRGGHGRVRDAIFSFTATQTQPLVDDGRELPIGAGALDARVRPLRVDDWFVDLDDLVLE